MKKFAAIALAALMSVGLLTGCGTSKKAAETTTAAKEETTANYGQGLNEDGTLKDVTASDYVTVCDYSKIKIPKDEVTASDSDVQSQIDSIMENYKTTKKVTNRKVKDGDKVNIDYTGTIDGEEFDGGSAEGYDLTIGSGSFIDNFEEQLIGKKPGSTVKVEVTFPDDYTDDSVAGKDAVFETKINYISVEKEQKVTDKFVKENLKDSYGYTSVKDMKSKIKENLENTNKSDYIWNYLTENSTFKEIPEELVNDRIDVLVDGLKSELEASSYSFDDYLSAYGLEDEAALREQYYSTCESTVKIFLIADAIAKEKNLSVTDEAVKEYFGDTDSSEYESYYTKAYVNRVVLNDVVLKTIEETAVVK